MRTKLSRDEPSQPLSLDALFFFRNAGFGYDPLSETREQGRTRGAISLAAAESLLMDAMRRLDVGITWEHDEDGAADNRRDRSKFDTCEQAYIWHRDEAGAVHYLASLCGITDATPEYRRVIRAELAQECAEQLRALLGRVGH